LQLLQCSVNFTNNDTLSMTPAGVTVTPTPSGGINIRSTANQALSAQIECTGIPVHLLAGNELTCLLLTGQQDRRHLRVGLPV
jgi:hypothetical protein